MFAFRFTVPAALAATCAGVYVLAQADDAPAPTEKEKIVVFCKAYHSQMGGSLHTTLTVNGNKITEFQAAREIDVTEYVKTGRNTVTFETKAVEPTSTNNPLYFAVGPVVAKKKKTEMTPVLLEYNNDFDWKFKEETGKYTHPFGPNPKTPNKKTVTHTYNFHYVGVKADRAEVKQGDYILQTNPYHHYNPGVVATISLNGKSLGSFAGPDRSLVITDLVKPGDNEIRIVAEATKDQLRDNDMDFEILGPMNYDVAKEKFLGKKLLAFKAMEGFDRSKVTHQLQVKGSDGETKHERTLQFTVETGGE